MVSNLILKDHSFFLLFPFCTALLIMTKLISINLSTIKCNGCLLKRDDYQANLEEYLLT